MLVSFSTNPTRTTSKEFLRSIQSLYMHIPRNYGIQEFFARILFTDEVTFSTRGMINLGNDHVETNGTPHELIKSNLQGRYLANVCFSLGNS